MTLKPAVYAAMLLYAAAGQLVIAVDSVAGDKAATIGAAALIGAVATAAGALLLRNVQANKQLFAQAMEQMSSLKTELHEEQERHDRTRASLDTTRTEVYRLRALLNAHGIREP